MITKLKLRYTAVMNSLLLLIFRAFYAREKEREANLLFSISQRNWPKLKLCIIFFLFHLHVNKDCKQLLHIQTNPE